MKQNILEYKGYHTAIEFDSDTFLLRGKIEGINDFVNFESNSPASIENEFHNAVDDYLEFCATVGKEPEKEYKGTFNIRITPQLHKMLAAHASKHGESLNSTVEKAIDAYLRGDVTTNAKLENTVKILTEASVTQGIYSSNEITMEKESKIVPLSAKKVKMSYQKEM